MAGIYIHIPFCRQACHYCNFHFSVSMRNRPAFIDALVREIELRSDYFKGKAVETLYIGGGTPSVLGISELIKIYSALGKCFELEKLREFTLEANPDDLTSEKLMSLRQLPVNRLSIGVQSFHHSDLRYMNRIHSPVQACESIVNARKAGFDNISADLIYGTPGMTNRMWEENIMQLIEFGVPHISAYALTVEKSTALEYFIRKGRADDVSEEQCAEQFDILCSICETHGYEHYEISNFCFPGKYSLHNLSYWTGKEYLGLGPSAHSYSNGRRCWNVSNTSSYIESLEHDMLPLECEELSPVQSFNEYVMTSLRTARGCDLGHVRKEWGEQMLAGLEKRAVKYIERSLLTREDSHLLITRQGKFLADGIAADLFSDS